MNTRGAIRANIILVVCAVALCVGVIEIFYRIFDPFPTSTLSDVNSTEHGNISQYHPVLGWSGVPSGDEPHVTRNRRVQLSHNSKGFRDIEHEPGGTGKPPVVFLGDSFTWGYEVEWDEMFVNLVRERLPDVEVFNLAHRGYGTDQSYLTYMDWQTGWHPELVVLMFSENDVWDNNTDFQYRKSKPYFQVADGSLVLEGVPVDKDLGWTGGQAVNNEPTGRDRIEDLLSYSHALMDVAFRIFIATRGPSAVQAEPVNDDLSVTLALVKALQANVEAAGAELVVLFIPSKVEVGKLSDAPPYQQRVKALFDENGITSFDMAGHMKSAWRRSYYRRGIHLNEYGHAV